jgi:predicted nucleic acid-binding Zn ribbon protein
MTKEILDISDFPDPIAQASYFRVYKCPTCPNAHIVLFDNNDTPFAQFAVNHANVMRIIKDTGLIFIASGSKH